MIFGPDVPADDELQAALAEPSPMAAIVRSMVALPRARPIVVRKSRRAIRLPLSLINRPPGYGRITRPVFPRQAV